jgi:integrase
MEAVLAAIAGARMPRMHPHMMRHTYVTTTMRRGRQPARHEDRRPACRPEDHHAL